MTREEVKAQLAKSPLEWQREARPFHEYDYLKAEVKRGGIRSEYRIRYDYKNGRIKRVSLYLTAMDFKSKVDEGIEVHILGNFQTLDKLKSKAEEHRLDLVCTLLGIEK